ncbi:acetoin utilization protein AcuC [Acidihalobacter prosperus]|uniref:Acetoin utilization protein AcuC n=1 Tax=Acidihalobacter prosperus TaxID=160660 RepID=A0A1A6C2E7_9GAMM|nr:acetoin utilization protein AcuC [Acidihalobacter prosperus]OBS08742.1 histone deacetylase [Acidihalobacter prosperus]
MTAPTAGSPRAVLIAAARYRRHSYGNNHPLDIPRVSLMLDVIRSYGALDEGEYVESRRASVAELEWFHTREYVSAMQRCEAMGKVIDVYRQQHNIGNLENPYFRDFFATPATATGGSIQGAEQLLAGRVAFSPAGGMHHAMPDRAQGFCYFNDAALAVIRLRRAGLRVLYVDIDAHHGDGVEHALRGDPGAFTLSLHMDTDKAYPFAGGRIEDTGGCANAVNLPLPPGTHDDEYRHAFARVWPAVMEAVRPDAVVLQAGTDPIMPDPLGKFRLSTQAFLEVAARIQADAPRHADGTPRLLVIGGGGYHPLVLARCWAGLWGQLSGRTLPVEMPEKAQALLAEVRWGAEDPEDDDEAEQIERAGTPYRELLSRRLDRPQTGPVRADIVERVDRLLDGHPAFRVSRGRRDTCC